MCCVVRGTRAVTVMTGSTPTEASDLALEKRLRPGEASPKGHSIPDRETASAKHKCGAKKKKSMTAAGVKPSNTSRGQAGIKEGGRS